MRSIYVLLGCWTALSLGAPASAQNDQREFSRGPARPQTGDSEHNPHITMQRPSYGGSGCPQGSVIATLSPAKTTISLIFQTFLLEAGAGADRQTRKNCDIRLPFRVPDGIRATVVALDYRGYNYLPQGGQAKYQARYYFEAEGLPGRRGGMTIRNLTLHGPEDDTYFLSSELRQRRHWSKCGQDFVLHIGNDVHLKTNSRMEPALSTIDSLDAVGREVRPADTTVKYHMVWKTCTPEENDDWGRS